jgi:hypothetical protein
MITGGSGGGDRRFRPSRQPTLGLASELSGYPDKAAGDMTPADADAMLEALTALRLEMTGSVRIAGPGSGAVG